MCLYIRHTCANARRGSWIPWSWSKKQLSLVSCVMWTPGSHPDTSGSQGEFSFPFLAVYINWELSQPFHKLPFCSCEISTFISPVFTIILLDDISIAILGSSQTKRTTERFPEYPVFPVLHSSLASSTGLRTWVNPQHLRFHVFSCFVCRCVCVLHACLVPTEARRGRQILWN